MKFPSLVPDYVCKTDIEVTLSEEGISEDGAPIEIGPLKLKCNYQDSAKMVLTEQKKLVQISGRALFNGDICPELPAISSGQVIVFGKPRDIMQGIKARNPDGTVNYTELILI
jgi:hypothetical protein